MELNTRVKLEAILAGKLSVTETQAILSELSDEEVKRLMDTPEMQARMKAYRERNQFVPSPAPAVDTREADRMWRQIVRSAPRTASPPTTSGGNIWQRVIQWLRDTLTLAPLTTYGITMAVLAVLIIVPVILMNGPWIEPDHVGMKGPAPASTADVNYAIVGADGVLQRPERALRQRDILAFRLKVHRHGYYSLYMVHRANVDPIMIERRMDQGTHDLEEAYALEGNAGTNHLVLVSAATASQLRQRPSPALIREAALNQVSNLTIAGQMLTIHTQTFEVE